MNAREAIEAGGRAIADAINSRDAAKIAQLYTADASVLPPGAPRQHGRDAVQAFWQTAIEVIASRLIRMQVFLLSARRQTLCFAGGPKSSESYRPYSST